jgi:exosortase/archaeosortase family protein
VSGILAGGLGFAGLHLFPVLEVGVFSAGSAKIAAIFYGTSALRTEGGWLLECAGRPVMVTAACSGTGFFVVLAAMLAVQFSRRGLPVAVAPALAMAVALPATLVVNAARLVAVVQMHAWIIPRMPTAFAAFLHLLTGAGVFLPVLIALNVYLEKHELIRRASR